MEAKTKEIGSSVDVKFIDRSSWLRAAVLGANDAILSTASIAIGVAAGTDTRDFIILATLAGLVAGALSMTASKFVSICSQTDTEKAEIERERIELVESPELEMLELAGIYEKRGLKKETAIQVAKEFTEKDALAAHVRDELGINKISQPKPLQSALSAGAAFIMGGSLSLMVTIFLPEKSMVYTLYGSGIFSLIILGVVTAKTGGSSVWKAITRITLWGTLVMGTSAFVGYLFGMNM
ncbi:MAG: VIT family protein [Dysgonamonadaceae bacterium]|jgi:VIT1/CCC1 family predicted Fe2+/Mn2+ transporter|nr:VIT family protein [Dysgonamonadaceae bacterium]MDD3356361.1 VIT family protein [Dysgonamonadaceae bacterium]MDD3727395.1 VIT family protein [Dysgonamonadaceae bacterium]MDD4246278.1 VIT family protein [Dysgonamonadaceae bacterium]MDD4605346.1 VIT family protein [Dysgonamonadaceae bacterium]